MALFNCCMILQQGNTFKSSNNPKLKQFNPSSFKYIKDHKARLLFTEAYLIPINQLFIEIIKIHK